MASKPSSPAAAPRLDKWTIIGMGGGGSQYGPQISAVDPDVVMVYTDMSEFYVSFDCGDSWRQCNVRGGVYFLACDPADKNVFYVRTRLGLFRSADGARAWELVHPRPDNVERLLVVGDHASETIAAKDGSDEMVEALAVDPEDSKTLYAAMSSHGRHYFSASTDWGATWTPGEELPWIDGYRPRYNGGSRRIYVDKSSPKGDRTLYVIGDRGTSRREGGRWTHLHGPERLERFVDASAGFPRTGGRPVIYATADAEWQGDRLAGGVYVSRDGGVSWEESTASFVKAAGYRGGAPRFDAVAACLTDASVAYVSYGLLKTGPGDNDFIFGLARTADGGRSWNLAVKNTPDTPSPNQRDAWMDERFGPIWGDRPHGLGVAPTDPDICFGTDDGRTMRTKDGLKTWEGVYSRKHGGGWTTTGLDMTTCYGVHWNPFDDNDVFISYTDVGLMRSADGGTSWNSATRNGVPSAWTNTTYWMVFDPDVKGRAWAVMTGIHDLPRPKMWRSRGVAHYNGGVVVTDDAGATWRQCGEGMFETAPTDIILDPRSAKDARTLYVAGFGTGVWKSTDSGATWLLKNRGIDGDEPFAWRIVMDAKGALYLVVARRSEDGRYGDAEDGALYKSSDGADTWQRLPLPEGLNGPHGVAVDPEDTDRLYLAAWGRHDPQGDRDGGIYVSTNGGRSWRNVFSLQQHVYDVTVDPGDPNVLYAGTMSFSVLRSADRGETWKRLKGYNFKMTNRVIVDPFDRSMLYVATFGGSVWHGPAEGDPAAVEDVVTPVVRYELSAPEERSETRPMPVPQIPTETAE